MQKSVSGINVNERVNSYRKLLYW